MILIYPEDQNDRTPVKTSYSISYLFLEAIDAALLLLLFRHAIELLHPFF